jgi:lipopolysaccharide export system permease protein
MGIGIVRAFGALQGSQELHVIHANHQIRPLFGGIATFAVGGAAILLFLSNFVEPWANYRLNDWSASIAADIVGRTLTPHRFSQVVPGVTVVIGGRTGTGNITDFFADDNRGTTRRTYSAKSATVAEDEQGYLLQLHDGTLQYLTQDGGFSEVAFRSYNLGLDKFTRAAENADDVSLWSTPRIIADAFTRGVWSDEAVKRVSSRLATGVQAIGMAVFVGALVAFPSGRRRRRWFPMELVPLVIAWIDITVAGNVAGPQQVVQFLGPVGVLVTGLLILLLRLKLLRLPLPGFMRSGARPA